MISLLTHAGLLVWGMICATQDMRSKKISNKLTLGLFTVALVYLLMTGHSLTQSTTEQAIMGLVFAIALSLPGYITGKMGAADVKMLCAIGLATQGHYVLICVIGAAVSLVIWSLLKPLWLKLPKIVHKTFPLMNPATGKPLPYAPFLFIGMIFATLLTQTLA
ncbi:MAG: prepilin peptidase [Pseudomonas sp.]|nr:prepilin peptidase [Pseudomonas sp.]